MDYSSWANYYDTKQPSNFVKACDASKQRQTFLKKIEVPQPKLNVTMDYFTISAQKALFTPSWPDGTDPRPTDYPYFMNKFCDVKGCNWWMFPCMKNNEPEYMGAFLNGDITLKFKLGDPCKYTKKDSDDRIGILIESSEHLYHVYVDEDADLFIDDTTNLCVGKLNMVRNANMWDGTASLDVDTIHTLYPYTVGKPKDWHHYS